MSLMRKSRNGCQEERQITYKHFNLLFSTHQKGTKPRYEP
jgi:hypothetical protein